MGLLVTDDMEHVKRSKKVNFTDDKVELLMHEVKQNKNVLFDTFRSVYF